MISTDVTTSISRWGQHSYQNKPKIKVILTESKRRGLILGGGSSTRLHPITLAVSKQLLPVYYDPITYYPLSTLMLAEIREILIITTPQYNNAFKELLGDGRSLGVRIEYAIQEKPQGLAQAFTTGKSLLNDSATALILGDNLFHGTDLANQLQQSDQAKTSLQFSLIQLAIQKGMG